jgi:hypothetical protein
MPLRRHPVMIVTGRKIRASDEVESKWSQNRDFVDMWKDGIKIKSPGTCCFQGFYRSSGGWI